MNYALDINNPRVKSALDMLGIDKDELLLKSAADFGNKGTREEIRQLRFEYYSKRLEDSVKNVKDLIRTMTIRTKSEAGKSVNGSSEAEESQKDLSDKSSVYKKGFLNEKNKEVLLTALEEIKEESQVSGKKERPRSMAQPRSVKVSRIEQFKKNQQANIERIRQNQEFAVRKALSQSFRISKPNKSSPKSKDFKNFTGSLKKELNFSPTDVEISEKLLRFDEKIEKSKVLHEKQLLMKKESARNQVSVTKLDNPAVIQDDLIFKIIERHKAVSERKEKKVQKLMEKCEKNRNFQEQKEKRIKELEQEHKRYIFDKEAILDKRLSAAEQFIKNRKASLGREVEMKIELQKLKDEEASIKVKRAQKIMRYKRDLIIDRQIAENTKFEAAKINRELSNNRKRDQAIQEMIEKERVNEVISIIKKTPQGKVAIELLKEFNMMPQKSEVTEDS